MEKYNTWYRVLFLRPEHFTNLEYIDTILNDSVYEEIKPVKVSNITPKTLTIKDALLVSYITRTKDVDIQYFPTKKEAIAAKKKNLSSLEETFKKAMDLLQDKINLTY